jgi:2-polyprenyl-6-methoxyphenol hydroxylase-like FAD-dependent oxidoreductase
MLSCVALFVGGGPAGSAWAGALRREGWDVRVIDQAQFPR